ncbi:MAG: FGGY-family carbohydrate kinase [Planctomycetota bacterium]
MKPPSGPLLLGVDVGTTSARAALFDPAGRLLGFAEKPIELFTEGADLAEHSSEDIWRSACAATREALRRAGAEGDAVAGVGFDATCSLVLLGEGDRPLPASSGGEPDRNVIVWMDHRAVEEAARINATGHPALARVGGAISPEMEPSKLLWIKDRNPEAWRALRHAFDLADWLSYRATGNDARSACTTVCKWLHDGRDFDGDLFARIGLADLLERGIAGRRVVPLLTDLGPLTAEAAGGLGLTPRARVATPMIDAHAGGFAVVGLTPAGRSRPDSVLAMILGTSSCFMATSKEPLFVPGVWGPYPGAMVPGYSLGEGGQSWSGAAVDFLLRCHPAFPEVESDGKDRYATLNRRLAALEVQRGLDLARDVHVLPDLHGNRSPLADPAVRGTVEGFDGDASMDGLVRLYAASLEGVAHGARRVLDAFARAGFRIEALHACGGGTKNPQMLQTHADALGLPLLLAECPESMPLGVAMAASVATGIHADFRSAMEAMARPGRRIEPRTQARAYHDRKHEVFLDLYASQERHRRAMEGDG